jgi:hypothetical protein
VNFHSTNTLDTVLSINVASSVQDVSVFNRFEPPRLTNNMLSKNRWTFFANGTTKHFIKLLVLEFLTSGIYIQDESLFPFFSNRNLTAAYCPDIALVLGFQTTQIPDVDDFVELMYKYESLLKTVQELTDAVEFLVNSISRSHNTSSLLEPEDVALTERIFVLRNICSQRLKNVQRHIEQANRIFEATNKALNIRESISVKRLTILASIFLPLSLASSLLSMQTRLINLHLLLYDFLGVFFLVSSLAILIYFSVRVVLKLKSTWDKNQFLPWAAWKFTYRSPTLKLKYQYKAIGLSIIYMSIWMVILTSFIVGMVFQVQLGLKILGYGFAGVLACVLCYFGLGHLLFSYF